MLARTYGLAGILLFGSAFAFRAGSFTATTQTLVWCVIFFFASAGASAAYLTISEVFPQEVRGKAIAVFFAITQVFGAGAPYLFGSLIDRAYPDRGALFVGYLGCAALMVLGAVVAQWLAVDAENKMLETFAEQGFPGVEATAWYGILAPAGTPKPVITRLHGEIVKILKLPDVAQRLNGLGFEIVGSRPDQLSAYIRSEIKKWAKVVKASGAKAD